MWKWVLGALAAIVLAGGAYGLWFWKNGREQPIERETGDCLLATAEIINSWQNASGRPVTMLIAEILPPNSEQ